MTENGSIQRDRADYEGFSAQNRLDENPDVNSFFASTYFWGREALYGENEPDYSSTSSTRDKWLLEYARKEPNLQGVLNAVVTIDKNRGWRFTGGRNQVGRFTRMLHNFQVAPGLFGWRPALSQLSLAFWNTDMGSVTELGRDGRNGPLRALYTVDPTQCKLTGNQRYPLEHSNSKNRRTLWRNDDFFRVASMVSLQEKFNGLGYSAVSRVLEMVKLMVAIHEHDKEELGAKAPRGLMLLQGISQEQWEDAMEAREADSDSRGFRYFSPVSVLANKNAKLDAKLVALSQLPSGFDLKEWMDILMYTYALCFGYDPAEFWPIQFGALGRGEEGSLQHEKATGKGRLDFVLGFQEQLQEFLPDTLEFAFEQKDDKGNLIRAQVNQAFISNVKSLYEIGVQYGAEGLITREQALMLLADYGVIPRSWAPTDKASTTDISDEQLNMEVNEDIPTQQDMQARVKDTKLKLLREELMERPFVWRCAESFPSEPIVQYSYPEDRMIILWDRADQLYRPRVWGLQ